MIRTIVAQKYARGLFAVGQERDRFKEYGEELKRVGDFLSSQPEILEVLQSPIYPPDLKMEIVEEIIKGLSLDEEVARFLKLLVEKKRIQFIAEIIEAYDELMDETLGIARAEVQAAFDLEEEDKQRLAEILKKLVGKEIKLRVVKMPELIGGIIVRVGDLVLDGSVRSQLESFRESIIKGEVA
ncbi:ATP synthase F1 subunit delta [Thermosulfurimonas dismutans]|uniref:ATP synthase subunit delta n=1 Tax=Thermosulfurimonas dismutans TaxID=999894 RepID=A0A179D698_9BACT|nr:ATP synthase F1 subunit delta [Thermosulfurimonas dismutans]OAQ21577.1 ATP synthase delta chain [Thermosulfurimonas dismutans]